MDKKELEKRIQQIRGFFEGKENFESIENEYLELIYDLWKEHSTTIINLFEDHNCDYGCPTAGKLYSMANKMKGEEKDNG